METKKQYFESFVEKKEGKMFAVASDATVDRMGDSLSADKWDVTNFVKNPVLQLSHDYNQPPVGIAKNLEIKAGKLFFEPVFHEITQTAREIKKLYKAGIMKAFSVGFIPAKEKDGKYELLEISAVAVPANPNALLLVKSFDAKTVKQVSAWVSKNVGGKEDFSKIERWNKSLPTIFNKEFDITNVNAPAATFNYDLLTKFFECKVKDIFQNNFTIPSPLLGSYLAGAKEVLSEFELSDTRNFSYNGGEYPPQYEVIQLNAEEKSEFLIEGTEFYKKDNDNKIVAIYQPSWYGITLSLITTRENKELNKSVLQKIDNWVKENNKLKGQNFALSGDFIETTKDTWKNVILEEDTKSSITKTIGALKNNKDFSSRGLMFVGKPGTGKTQTGRIIMNNTKEQTFIWVSTKDFFRIGSIGALKLAFQMARDLAPSILFMEDNDSWLRDDNSIDL